MGQEGAAIGGYYDWLSRFQTIVHWLGHRGGFDPLTVHRLLNPDRSGVAPADVVHERILSSLEDVRPRRILDAGCGLGGTVFFLHERIGGQYDGLTLSGVQRARAAREAERRGIASDCRFHVRSYDEPLGDVAPEGLDLIVAIESLAHAPHPARSIAKLAPLLRTGGLIAVVDDVPSRGLAEADQDFAAFKNGWSCPGIAGHAVLRTALSNGKLSLVRDEDLTPLVPLRDEARLERLIKINRRARKLLGSIPPGPLVESLHGGLMLERLYRRGLMQYRFLLARAGRGGQDRQEGQERREGQDRREGQEGRVRGSQ
jgi:SAM-dependent methyltransferase